MFLFISGRMGTLSEFGNSNTSHVLVYHSKGLQVVFHVHEFKYISCSCLSTALTAAFTAVQSFKYISCSCLSSASLCSRRAGSIQIHLMFLFIKPRVFVRFTISLIQIHLMFLFITKSNSLSRTRKHSNTSHVLVYQYPRDKGNLRKYIQIHLMFLFISCRISESKKETLIQIHLMFLFIQRVSAVSKSIIHIFS